MDTSGNYLKEIAVIGGGLGGCLTALMLARQKYFDKNKKAFVPKYHVTLIEAQDTLLNDASLIASRLHATGMEYPLHTQTAEDCMKGAVLWKLLMPKTIYTPPPPMKFLVAAETQAHGEAHPDEVEDGKALTLNRYKKSHDEIATQYRNQITALVNNGKAWFPERNEKQRREAIEQALFGPPEALLRELKPEEYADYNQGETRIAGGFQSQEPGLNVPKYLTMLQEELKEMEKQGNLTVLTGHKVVKHKGIVGRLGQFFIECTGGGRPFTLKDKSGHNKKFDQVILAAARGNPEITADMGNPSVNVYKRAMLLVDLPKGWKTPPAFIMLDKFGGMLSPYNDKVAVCYLPTLEAAYRRGKYRLTEQERSLPPEWDTLTEAEEKEWTQRYFELLKKRFPVLEKASNPRLLVRDTLSFQQELSQRMHQPTAELQGPVFGVRLWQVQQQKRQQVERTEMQHVQLPEEEPHAIPTESKPGVILLYPTKATYALRTAIQATEMVNEREENKGRSALVSTTEDPLSLVLRRPKDTYSLEHMKEPAPEQYKKFFDDHPALASAQKILETSWLSGLAEETGSYRTLTGPLASHVLRARSTRQAPEIE